jgi:hypothetical protein
MRYWSDTWWPWVPSHARIFTSWSLSAPLLVVLSTMSGLNRSGAPRARRRGCADDRGTALMRTARNSRRLEGPVCGRMPPGLLAEIGLIADRGAGQWVCMTNERRSGCRALAIIGERAADGRAVSGGSGSRLRVPIWARPSSRRWGGPGTGSPTTRTAWRMRHISAAHPVAWLSPTDLRPNWGSGSTSTEHGGGRCPIRWLRVRRPALRGETRRSWCDGRRVRRRGARRPTVARQLHRRALPRAPHADVSV